jgi:4,4'-diaponeurosporenoate glycosyltransferase
MNSVVVAATVAGWCAGWLVGRARRLPPPPPAAPPFTISVIVPARNEAARLTTLLDSLDPGDLDIIVVDDSSSDDTAAIARAAGASVIRAEPPPGWTGKAFACWQGARAAKGEILVFVDADVEATVAGVIALAGQAASTKGLVSLQPFHRVERLYEQASAIPNLVAVMGAGTGARDHRRWWRRPAAFGMVLAIPRAAYFETGGHEAVRGAVAEDLALARVVDRYDVSVSAWCGADGLRVRMYGEGPRQLFEGWRKNLATGASSVPPLRLLCVVAWVTALTQASALVLLEPGLVSLVIYGAFVAQTALLAGRVGGFRPGVILALPLLVLSFLVIFAASAYATVTGRDVTWRGRTVATRPAR